MQENKVKRMIRSGQAVFGCFTRYADSNLTELLSLQGFDFLVFDAEHGPIEPRDCLQMVRSAELHGITPIVRPTTNQKPILLRYLDTGVQGVLVPMVCTVADAHAVVHATKFQPLGSRGLAGSRSADYGQKFSLPEYAKFSNEQTLVVVQIETVEAIQALPQIVNVDAVDVIFVGPADLSQSLGVTGQMQHPKLQQAIDRIQEIVAESDKGLGIMVGNADAANKWVDRGAKFIAITIEAMVKAGCRPYLNAVRDH